jgi:hypothetical protein
MLTLWPCKLLVLHKRCINEPTVCAVDSKLVQHWAAGTCTCTDFSTRYNAGSMPVLG